MTGLKRRPNPGTPKVDTLPLFIIFLLPKTLPEFVIFPLPPLKILPPPVIWALPVNPLLLPLFEVVPWGRWLDLLLDAGS